jgi:hypothetical protein
MKKQINFDDGHPCARLQLKMSESPFELLGQEAQFELDDLELETSCDEAVHIFHFAAHHQNSRTSYLNHQSHSHWTSISS